MKILYYQNRSGVVRASCSNGQGNNCGSSSSWMWTGSGRRLSSESWSRESGDPHSDGGDPEECAILWAKHGFKMADWTCSARAS